MSRPTGPSSTARSSGSAASTDARCMSTKPGRDAPPSQPGFVCASGSGERLISPCHRTLRLTRLRTGWCGSLPRVATSTTSDTLSAAIPSDRSDRLAASRVAVAGAPDVLHLGGSSPVLNHRRLLSALYVRALRSKGKMQSRVTTRGRHVTSILPPPAMTRTALVTSSAERHNSHKQLGVGTVIKLVKTTRLADYTQFTYTRTDTDPSPMRNRCCRKIASRDVRSFGRPIARYSATLSAARSPFARGGGAVVPRPIADAGRRASFHVEPGGER